MKNLDKLLQSMSFDFFGSGKHKIEMEKLLETRAAVFLDVRSRQECESLQIKLQYHLRVICIPIDEIPARCNEIPRDKTVGIFCSAGTRSTLVYAYLRALGYENVRIATGNYEDLISLLLPGKLHKTIVSGKTDQGK